LEHRTEEISLTTQSRCSLNTNIKRTPIAGVFLLIHPCPPAQSPPSAPCNEHATFNAKTSIHTVRSDTIRKQKRAGNRRLKCPEHLKKWTMTKAKTNHLLFPQLAS